MGKALVCNGDPTTTGGHVIAKASTMFDGERRIALDREMAKLSLDRLISTSSNLRGMVMPLNR